MRARVLQDHRNAAVQVGEQQHPGGARADLGDTADQATFVERDFTLADAVVRTHRQQHRLGIDPAGVGHDTGGDVAGRRVWDPAQVGLEPLVLGVERQCDRLPAAEEFVLVAQAEVLGADVPQVGGAGDAVAERGERRGERGVDRRQRVRQRHAGALGQQRICLAEQHQPEGGRDQHRQGELGERLAGLDGETDHAGDLSLVVGGV